MKPWVFILVFVLYPATARTQSITVGYRQTISVPARGALAAFSLDDFYAEAKVQDETLIIVGKNPGLVHILEIANDGTKTFEIHVLPAPPSYPPRFCSAIVGCRSWGERQLRITIHVRPFAMGKYR
jgi:hypothetical protein